MSNYVFYQLNEQVGSNLNPQNLPYPIRAEHEREIFGGKKVALDKLMLDLGAFLQEYPELRAQYADNLGRLAYLAGVEAVTRGSHPAALSYFESGLAAVPGNLSLRTNYALTLHRLGRETDALSQYELILSDPDSSSMPVVLLLAARICAKQGHYMRAYSLLKECAPLLPDDKDLQKFMTEMQQKASQAAKTVNQSGAPSQTVPTPGKSDQRANKPTAALPANPTLSSPAASEATPPSTVPAAHTCAQCGKPLTPGANFCRNCGTTVQPTPATMPKPPIAPPPTVTARVCAHCGNPIPLNAKFCRNCGQSV